MGDVARGLLDTSVLIDHDLIEPDRLPAESPISAVSLAEFAAGPTPLPMRTNARVARIGCNE